MKHIKNYELFEGIVRPYDFDKALEELKSLPKITQEDLEKILAPLDVEFVDIEYFRSKLQTQKEIELVPERPMLGGLRFAAFNYYTNKMYIVVFKWDMFLRDLNNNYGKDQLFALLREILRHESIHKQQNEKRAKKGVLLRHLEDSPEVPDKYFGSYDEIMAYAQSFIDQCKERGLSDDQILKQIKSNKKLYGVGGVYSKMSPDVLKRFKNYVYKYITD